MKTAHKTILQIDLYIQKFLVGANGLISAISIFFWPMAYMLMVAQFIVGAYQMTSSLFALISGSSKNNLYKWRLVHFFGSLLYLLLLGLAISNDFIDGYIYTHEIVKVILFVLTGIVIPQLIMYAYFYLSYLWFEQKEIKETQGLSNAI